MSEQFCPELEDRLVRYCSIDTTSDDRSDTVPSTPSQLDLQRTLEQELREMRAANVTLAENGFLYATIPATAKTSAPVIAFLAHVDTVAGIGGAPAHPQVHRQYDGSRITFPDDPALELSVESDPYLTHKIGEDIITAGGGTILGADDKAGVAIIMTLARHLLAHPEISHGEIRLCTTPDEEIGRGIRHIDLGLLGAGVAYTLDGSEAGAIESETFSADKAIVTVTGVSTHPGSGKGKLVNALQYAASIVASLPRHTRTPDTTAGHEGFIHLTQLEGTAEKCTAQFILRDFELAGLAAHGDLLQSICATVQKTEPRLHVECKITPQYRNMRYWLEKDMRPVSLAERAVQEIGLKPISSPVRGGTDGSQLTEMGVPTPNLFTGMRAFHSPLEWVSVQDMAKAVAACTRLAELWAEA